MTHHSLGNRPLNCVAEAALEIPKFIIFAMDTITTEGIFFVVRVTPPCQ